MITSDVTRRYFNATISDNHVNLLYRKLHGVYIQHEYINQVHASCEPLYIGNLLR